jgi:chromosome segregation ATPase
VYELEISIAEKERMLSQQQRTVELRDLQLQQERDVVRGLRASLREEEQAKRELQARYEAINSEMLVRNAREAIADSRMSELERELSELNLTLSSSRNENERLGQEIREVRQSNVS